MKKINTIFVLIILVGLITISFIEIISFDREKTKFKSFLETSEKINISVDDEKKTIISDYLLTFLKTGIETKSDFKRGEAVNNIRVKFVNEKGLIHEILISYSNEKQIVSFNIFSETGKNFQICYLRNSYFDMFENNIAPSTHTATSSVFGVVGNTQF